LRAAAGRHHRHRAGAADGRPLLGSYQLDGVLMEPLTRAAGAARFSRRTLLRGASLAGLGWLSPVGQILTGLAQEAPHRPAAPSLILLWLAGGPSQLETFDPHPGTPIAGGTGAVDTPIRGVQLAAGYPRLAEQMESLAILRSVVSREGDHERGTYNLM